MFDKVVFAGGGQRCWWQAGFWEVLRDEIELRPRVIGAVSMGAFMACLVHANDARRALAWFERELAGVGSNVTVLNLFRKDAPLFRQGGIYRRAMRALLGGEHFRQLMWQAPEIRVACALPPPALTDRQLNRLGWREYRRDARLLAASLHEPAEHGEAFTPFVKRLQDCRTERDMSDLLQATSALPPVVAPVLFDGDRACSGELIDPVPVDLVSDVPGQTLVLTTRTYNRKTPVFAMKGRIYVQPSAPVPVSSWDFTSARRAQQTYELGRQDGEAVLKLFGLGSFGTGKRFDGALLAGGGWGDEAREETVIADEGASPVAEAGKAGRAGSAGNSGRARASGASGRSDAADASGDSPEASGRASASEVSGTSDASGSSEVSDASGVSKSSGSSGVSGAPGASKPSRASGASGADVRDTEDAGTARGAKVPDTAGGRDTAEARHAAEAGRASRRARSASGAGEGHDVIGATDASGKPGTSGGSRASGRSGASGVAGTSEGSGASKAAGTSERAADSKAAGASGRRAASGADADAPAQEDPRATGASADGLQDTARASRMHEMPEENPLTLTDGHTLGEPSDKLFERAGRLRRKTTGADESKA